MTAPSVGPRDLLPSLARARLLLLLLLLVAILIVIVASFAIAVGIGLVLDAADERGPLDQRLPRLANAAIFLLPVLCWIGALLLQRRNVGRTFYQQARDNRWASLLLVIALVGVLAAAADMIAAIVVFEAEAGLLAAAIAALVGVLVALVAVTVGRDIVTWSVHAHPDRRRAPHERRDRDGRGGRPARAPAAGAGGPQHQRVRRGQRPVIRDGRGHPRTARSL